MKPLERRVGALERAAADASQESMSFDIRFVDAGTKAQTGRLIFNGDGTQSNYEPDGNGGWRLTSDPT